MRFQNVRNLQIFVKDNQGGEDVTQIDFLSVIGTTKENLNTDDLKKGAFIADNGYGQKFLFYDADNELE